MEEISIKAQELFHIGSVPITNSLLVTLIVSGLLIMASFLFSRKIKLIPSVAQSFVEVSVTWLLGLMENTLGSAKAAEQYFPLVATVFIFIVCSNVLGIFPGVGSIHVGQAPLFRSPAADLNFTLAFAVISVLVTNILGAAAVGVWPHIGKFFNFSSPIQFFIGILELVSEIAKIISLSFRLFGNVFAGEVLLTIIFSLAPYLIPLPFLFLELFIGLIQAFLFAMLTLVSLSLHTLVHQEQYMHNTSNNSHL